MFSVMNPLGVQTPASFIDRCDTVKAQDLFIKGEHLVPAPVAEVNKLTEQELLNFCFSHGIYSLPTTELVQFIEKMIPNKDKAIEIGSGNGVYARSLGIRGTDNYMQHPKNRAKFKNAIAAYERMGQPLVQYGDDVEEIDGRDAVRKYKAETVVCAWVTHKWNPCKPELEGNMFGVDFEWLWKRSHVQRIILIGNEFTHKNNPLMKVPHTTYDLPWIKSRTRNPELDRVYVWEK